MRRKLNFALFSGMIGKWRRTRLFICSKTSIVRGSSIRLCDKSTLVKHSQSTSDSISCLVSSKLCVIINAVSFGQQAKFSSFLIELLLRFIVSNKVSGSRFSIFLIRFCCRNKLRSSFWLSKFSIRAMPFDSNHSDLSPVYSSKFSILPKPRRKL